MSTFDAGAIEARLVLDRSDFTRGLDQSKTDADKFSGKDYTAKVKADTTAADKSLSGTQAKADKLGKSSPTVKVAVDDAQTTAKIAQAQARILRLNNIIARPQVSLEVQKAYTELDALNAKLDELGKQDPTPKVTADTADAQAKIDDLTAKLDRLETRDTEVRVKASADLLKAQADLAKLQQGIESVGTAEEGAAASGGLLSGSMGLLKSPIAALIAGGAALSPILVTSGIGLAGVAGAAVSAAKPIENAAKQAGGLRANLATLNPEQQEVARGLLGLQANYASFTKSLQPEVFSAFNSGLATAKALLHDAAPVAESAGKGLDHVLADINANFHTSEWTQFFSFMAQTAGPDIQAVGQAFLSLLNALPPLLEDLQPVGLALLDVASKGGEALGIVGKVVQAARSSEQQDSNNDSVFDKFKQGITWITDHAPEGHKSIGDLVAGWLGVTGSAGQAATAQGHAVTAMQQAQPSATNLAADVSILASNTANAAAQTTALDDAWNILVGNFASKETAILNAQSAVQQFGKSVQQNGAGSLAAKTAFESAVTSIGQMVAALQKAHAPAAQIYTDLQGQISALEKSGPLNAEETQQLNGMKQAADAVAQSTVGWTGATKGAASALEGNLLPQLSQMKANTPVVRGDIDNLTTSIINTGTKSSASSGARAKLIADLKAAGVQSQTAKAWVDKLQGSIDNLHGKTVQIHMNGQGLYTITGSAIAKSQGPGGSGNAAGGLATGGRITGPGGPTADKAGLYALSHDEWVIRASSSNRYGHAAMDAVNRGTAVIGYAAGGQAGGAAVSGNLSGSYVTGMYGTFQTKMTDAMVASMRATLKVAEAAAVKAAQAAASSGAPGAQGGPTSASAAQAQSYARGRLGAYGWGADQMSSLIALWNQESGWNRLAKNPSSGAYGIPQALPASKMGAAANPPTSSAAAQINWGLSYIKGRYGSPAGAEAHERANNWYAKGTSGAAPGWAVTGEQGRELVLMRGGETVLPHAATERVLAMHSSMPGYASGTANAKTSAASLAGIISGAPKEGWQGDVSSLKHDLSIIATSLGIKGLTKADTSKLKGEQGKDTNELLVATAYLKTLQSAKKQITSVTEPNLRKQITALTALGKSQKLSASENRLLKTLKASLASQQAKLGRINVAISGKPAAKAKASGSGTSADDGSGDAGGGDAGGDSGSASTTANPTPVVGAANITLGAASAYGGSQFTLTPTSLPGTGGTFSGVPAGSAYQLPGGLPASPVTSAQGPLGSGGNVERLLSEILHATRAVPAGVSGGMGAALSGSAQAGYFAQRYPHGGY